MSLLLNVISWCSVGTMADADQEPGRETGRCSGCKMFTSDYDMGASPVG